MTFSYLERRWTGEIKLFRRISLTLVYRFTENDQIRQDNTGADWGGCISRAIMSRVRNASLLQGTGPKRSPIFDRSALKGVGINTGEPPKLGSPGTRLSWDGSVADPKIHVVLGQTVRALLRRSA